MITKDQLSLLSKKHKTNDSTILREYAQLYFLSRLYNFTQSQKIFFKGGTAIHLIYGSPRFSEDLDFTVELSKTEFQKFIKTLFSAISNEVPVKFKERKTLTGKKFLLTWQSKIVSYPIFISLDFSFREKIIYKTKSIIKTDFPVLFYSYIYHPTKKELLAEKVRALLTRKAGRDLYDIWFLLSQKAEVDQDLILQKLKYYQINKFKPGEIKKAAKQIGKDNFILDLKPFVSLPERKKLASFYDYLIDSLETHLT